MQITRLHTMTESSQTKTTRPLNRRIKTIQSIMSNAQSPQSNFRQSLMSKQHIFMNNQFVFTQQNEDRHTEMTFLHDTLASNQQMIQTNRAEQPEYQNDQISRMKLMFQSRMNSQKHNKTYHPNKSIDRSPHSKSIEKHILKPTNIPNFNKLFQKSQQQQYTSTLESPNFNQQTKQKQTLQNQIINLHKSSVNTDPINEKQTLKVANLIKAEQNKGCQSVQKRNILQCSGISSKFAEYEFGSQIKDHSPSVQYKVSERQQNQSPICTNNLNFNFENDSKRQSSLTKQNRYVQESSSQHKNRQCNCQSLLRTFMQQTNNKMAEITERLMILQNQNVRLKKIEQKFIQNNKIIENYERQTKFMQKECNQLKQSNYSYQAEKQELQSLLKQILFKREKEKYHQTSTSSSKQNTQRYDYESRSRLRMGNQTNKQQEIRQEDYEVQQTNYDKRFDSSYKKDPTFIVKKGIQPLSVKNLNQSQKQPKSDKKQPPSQSKIKMQNLLSKIQIKIQKN